jgi:hypothetical protein
MSCGKIEILRRIYTDDGHRMKKWRGEVSQTVDHDPLVSKFSRITHKIAVSMHRKNLISVFSQNVSAAGKHFAKCFGTTGTFHSLLQV